MIVGNAKLQLIKQITIVLPNRFDIYRLLEEISKFKCVNYTSRVTDLISNCSQIIHAICHSECKNRSCFE